MITDASTTPQPNTMRMPSSASSMRLQKVVTGRGRALPAASNQGKSAIRPKEETEAKASRTRKVSVNSYSSEARHITEASRLWWQPLFPQLPPVLQDVGLLLGHTILSYLSLVDLDLLQVTSRNMQAGRNAQIHTRLRVLHYSDDFYGYFHKRKYTRSGREVRPLLSMSSIATRTQTFLSRFAAFIEELQFGSAPCALLEQDDVLSALSHMRFERATFPGEGWSGVAAIRRVIAALQEGVSYQFMTRRGHVVRSGVVGEVPLSG